MMKFFQRNKKWREYLFEIIVIFIGITSSFLFEEWRQSLEEREKEQEYYKEILENIRSDSSNIGQVKKWATWSIPRIETMIQHFKKDPFTDFEKFSCAPYAFKEEHNLLISIESIQKNGKLSLIRRNEVVHIYNQIEKLERKLNDRIKYEAQIWANYNDYKLENYPYLSLSCTKYFGQDSGVEMTKKSAKDFLADPRVITIYNSFLSMSRNIEKETDDILMQLTKLKFVIREELIE